MAKLSVNELTVRRTAVDTMVPESIVEKVVSFAWKECHESFVNHSEFEFVGLGIFSVRNSKVNRMIVKLEKKLRSLEFKLQKNISKGTKTEMLTQMLEQCRLDLQILKEKHGV